MFKNKDHRKIYNMLINNLRLLDRANESTKEEQELIFLIVLYEIRKITSDIINEWQKADG
jgi:hypothetical protein